MDPSVCPLIDSPTHPVPPAPRPTWASRDASPAAQKAPQQARPPPAPTSSAWKRPRWRTLLSAGIHHNPTPSISSSPIHPACCEPPPRPGTPPPVSPGVSLPASRYYPHGRWQQEHEGRRGESRTRIWHKRTLQPDPRRTPSVQSSSRRRHSVIHIHVRRRQRATRWWMRRGEAAPGISANAQSLPRRNLPAGQRPCPASTTVHSGTPSPSNVDQNGDS
ncbi:hypothetical protein ACCO45_005208 [Purpureocillium lilacinum]|uniref:Uncharacterized protein n=1 Tax=Purpureocillium lilacinum TaxID=33203 RepID=A0ACC4DUS1_PURLI